MKRNYYLFLKDIVQAMEAIEKFVEGMNLRSLLRMIKLQVQL
jgi:uncharacterized protein with HEPN domain